MKAQEEGSVQTEGGSHAFTRKGIRVRGYREGVARWEGGAGQEGGHGRERGARGEEGPEGRVGPDLDSPSLCLHTLALDL